MKPTPEQQVIKSMLAILDATPTDGEPVSDAMQKLSFLHAETIRNICKAYGVELDETLPFENLCEEIKHKAKVDCFNNTPATEQDKTDK